MSVLPSTFELAHQKLTPKNVPRVPESLYKGTLAGLPPAVTGSIGKGVINTLLVIISKPVALTVASSLHT